MNPIYLLNENDKCKVIKLRTNPSKKRFYEAIGIFEGAELFIFFKNHENLILKIGENKFALSRSAAKEIFAEKIL